jgi:hypothetical protein
MNSYGFNDEHEALMSEYRPLIDARKVQSYPRKRNQRKTVVMALLLSMLLVVCYVSL